MGGDIASNYSNYREVGGELGNRKFYGAPSGPNTNGHFILYGGRNTQTPLNDIWIIPQDPCVVCDANAVCVSSDMWSSANCTCNAGYTGDGKTCTEITATFNSASISSRSTKSSNQSSAIEEV